MQTLKNGIIDDFASCGALFKPTVSANAMPLNRATRIMLQENPLCRMQKTSSTPMLIGQKHLNRITMRFNGSGRATQSAQTSAAMVGEAMNA